jgi:hypothetical protein
LRSDVQPIDFSFQINRRVHPYCRSLGGVDRAKRISDC